MVEVLHAHAARMPDQVALIFLAGDDNAPVLWTYRDIAMHASRVAAALSACGAAGKRVLLLYEPGPEYVAALFGAMQAGAIAVPSFPPMGTRALQRLAGIVADADPGIVLTTGRFCNAEKSVRGHCGDHAGFLWLNTNELPMPGQQPEVELVREPVQPSALALLQYTSGSTGEPKGVMISHGNLMSNSRALLQAMSPAGWRMGCSWLPPYHDMGLMGGILLPLYAGFPVILFSAMHFVQNPARWLRAISRYQVTVTVAPNFALDLCTENITEDEIANMDLSSVTDMFCGAEPIRKSSVDAFVQRFARKGFRRDAFLPCYGLAEATLFVSGKKCLTVPRHAALDQAALDAHRVVEASERDPSARFFISCGEIAKQHAVLIVDPDTCMPCKPGRVGEIWVTGPNVAQGYWGRPQETAATFQATLAGGSGCYMRTGDLGFLRDGELFVTGRIKDVIIIAGRNHYPQDIELTVQNAHPDVRANGVAAFRIDAAHGEALVIVAELRRRTRTRVIDVREVRDAVISHTAAVHGVRPHVVHLGPIGTLPLTTSGKVRRRQCRQEFLAGRLPALREPEAEQEVSHAGA
jgi:acyl-CoA synthetase (AMP-forming)/AMP-acid ligase II